ncbi:MAG TPA: ribonuclease P protein component [Usitatibacter sp.]|nr:ribonuclease P protein component [Usitatibacter sp.]
MARSPRPEGFSRRHRFSTQGSFGAILRSPRKFRGNTVVLNVVPAVGSTARLGIAVTRRLVPLAVERNRFKRLVRDVFRHHQVKGRGLDCVVALRKPFDGSAAPALREELRELFDQLAAN